MNTEINVSHLKSLIVITGMSGAGRSTALATLEDQGYLVVGNLPVALFVQLIEYSTQHVKRFSSLALVLDIGTESSVLEAKAVMEKLSKPPAAFIFLDCDDEILVKRFGETRRPHPLMNSLNNKDALVSEAISRERENLQPLRKIADVVIDTTGFTVHTFKRELKRVVLHFLSTTARKLQVTLISFGYKYGIPKECELILDVRFLSNPFFVPGLKHHDGRDPNVSKYVFDDPQTIEFYAKLKDLLSWLIPKYVDEGKSYLNIGIGCTGGVHRSVAVIEKLFNDLAIEGATCFVRHRDINRW